MYINSFSAVRLYMWRPARAPVCTLLYVPAVNVCTQQSLEPSLLYKQKRFEILFQSSCCTGGWRTSCVPERCCIMRDSLTSAKINHITLKTTVMLCFLLLLKMVVRASQYSRPEKLGKKDLEIITSCVSSQAVSWALFSCYDPQHFVV